MQREQVFTAIPGAVTVPTDACATLSVDRHEWSLRNNRGYCRQVTTDALLEEISQLTGTPT